MARIEAIYKGLDTRYVVINIRRIAPQWLYDSLYCARGQAENLIKRHRANWPRTVPVAVRRWPTRCG